MQSVHQTFLSLSLGAAIILGVAESSSAQIRRSGHPDSLDTQSAYSPASGSVSPESIAAPISVMPMVAGPELILDTVPFDNYSVMWGHPSTTPLPDNDTALLLLTSDSNQSVGSQADHDQSMAQLPESTVGDAITAETADEAAAASENEPETPEPFAETDTDAEPSSFGDADPLYPASLDSPDRALEESTPSVEESTPITDEDSTDEVEGGVELEVTPDGEAPSVEVEIQIPEIELDDGVDVELNSALIDIPAYLLSPPNPLFVPINPETVEILGTQPISLEQALEIARYNSRDLQVAIQTLEQSQQALREARAAYLPTITLTSQLEHTDRDISAEPGVSPTTGQAATLDETFTVETNLNLDITVNYNIFTSGLRAATVRAAENNVRLQELQVEVVQEDLRLNVTSGYYDLQDTDERVRIAQDTLEQSRISLRDAAAREEAGVGTRFDRLQAEVQLAEDEQDLVISIRDQSIARRALVDALSLPPGIDLSASDPVEVAGSWALPLEDTLLLAYRNRAELEQQLVQRDLNLEQARAALANRWPQLSAFASYTMNDLLDFTRSTSDFEDLSVGLQLSWTLYNGGANRAAARQEEIAAAIDETTFADTREQIRFEVEQQYLTLGAEFKNIQTAKSAVGLAEESLRLARLRFGAGVGIQSDVLEAQTQLSEAEGRLVTAILDYNRALIGIQRAVSNWPDNNLSADPIRESLTILD